MNVNVTKIRRLSNGMVLFYNGLDVVDSFSATSSVSVGFESNIAKTIVFSNSVKTLSFNVFNTTSIYGSTGSKIFPGGIDPSDTSDAYISRLYEIYAFLITEIVQGCCPGPTFVGGVVASYPNFVSFPVIGTQSVIYIDEADNSAYYWDGTSYQLLVSTGVEQYATFALFPVTGSANVIYIDMSVPEPYVWNGTAYDSLSAGSVTWGTITGTLSAQTDLQAALDAKFDDPTGTTAEYIRGDGTLATFPAIPGGTVTSVGTTGLISGGPITSSGTITTSMATNKLVGRYSASTGIMEEVSVGSGLTLTGAGILNNTATPTPTGYYGAFQDNTRQLAAVINTPYAVKLNTTELSDGITIVNNGSGDPTRITIANTGIYNIQFSLQLEKGGGSGNMTADIWLRKNGVDVPSTTGKVVLTGSASASPVIAAWNYVLDVVGGNYYELMWAVSNIHVEIFAEVATPPHPATPSAILTVTQQAGIMAGTGITAINSLTGAVQTLATGTTGTDFAISSTGTTHTFNLPTASAANRGALSSTDWTTFNGKFTLPSLTSGSVLFSNGTTIAQNNASFFWDNTNNYLGLGISTPGARLDSITSANRYALRLGQNTANTDGSWTGIKFQLSTTTSNTDTQDGQVSIRANRFAAGNQLQILNGATIVATFGSASNGLLLGTTTDAGFKLDVNGTARINGNATFGTLAAGTGMFWDSTNNRLGIGTASPTNKLTINVGAIVTQGVDAIYLDADATSVAASSGIFFRLANTSGLMTGSIRTVVTSANAQRGMQITSLSRDGIMFLTNATTPVEVMRINGVGNLLIGTTTDAGFKLDVNGTARVSGLITANLGVTVGSGLGGIFVQAGSIAGRETIAVRGGLLATDVGNDIILSNGQGNATITIGTRAIVSVSRGFTPTSGTGVFNTMVIEPPINQTGGANGITRGLYINPTLTAAADFRAIEVASGTTVLAPSTTLRASLRIPSGTAPTSPVNGDIWFDGTNIQMRIGGVTKTFTLL